MIELDNKNTIVRMSLLDYEHLKECQNEYKDLISEIKSIIKPTNTGDNSVEITIDKKKLEKFLFNFATCALELEHLEHTRAIFLYK